MTLVTALVLMAAQVDAEIPTVEALGHGAWMVVRWVDPITDATTVTVTLALIGSSSQRGGCGSGAGMETRNISIRFGKDLSPVIRPVEIDIHFPPEPARREIWGA